MFPLVRLSTTQVVFLFLFYISAYANEINHIQVTSENGPIIGEIVTESTTHQQLNRFLGIPYAQAPIGKLRFRRPVPIVPNWTEPFRALNWPASCVQSSTNGFVQQTKSFVLNQNQSEDCLFLNVWAPKGSQVEDKLKSVLFWIYGGGNCAGTSSFDIYDSATLSALTDAVIVTVNYRLSTLGFLYSDQVNDVKGNQGLWDQALALKWVKNNIAHFGGDPNRVTISGESAGSQSVSCHIISPVSQNLFQNAILMSGSVLSEKLVSKPSDSVQKWLSGIRKVGCATEHDRSINSQVIECLEKLDADKIDQIMYLVDKLPFEFVPTIVIDGEFLPAKPFDLLNQTKSKANVNLLISTVEDEGSFVHVPQLTAQKNQTINYVYSDFLISLLENGYLPKPVPRELIRNLYFSGLNSNNSDQQDEFRKRIGIAYGDLHLSCPTIEFAKNVFRFANNLNYTKIYQWYYRTKLGKDKVLCPKYAGACHFSDVYPLFGMPLRHPHDYLPREQDISAEIIGFIKNFIWSGNPGKDNSEWLPYFSTSDNRMDIIAPYYEINNQAKVVDNFKFNLKQLECDKIWNQFNY